ncbi:hypothetical protein F1559_000790 [Cyanidiococcus yangmingshanensis]|uniref:Maspardin n=1 Tax=Cyanidiococcus yangmingshanensis TaxID=2690220 RepID=A0A7J7INP0_9RHOD|nr:hypothetical protein F1559_000790 [Cyanidiococcus yangmingshanensis]
MYALFPSEVDNQQRSMKRPKVLDQSESESWGQGRPEHPGGFSDTLGPRRARLVGSREYRLWYYYVLGRENAVGTLVLLPDHLNGASGLYALATAAALAGHRVVLIDWPEHVHTVEVFQADLDELLQALCENESITTQVHLVGAGLGALLALRFAQYHPNSVASLALAGALWQQETLHGMLPLWSLVGHACASSLKLPRTWLERSLLDSSRVTIQDAHLYRLLYPVFRDRVQQASLGSLCTRVCLLRSVGNVGAIRLPEERMSLMTPLPRGWRTTQTDGDTDLDRFSRARWPYTGPAARKGTRVSSNPQRRGSFPAQIESQPRALLWHSFKQCFAFWTRNAHIWSVKAVSDDADTIALMTLFPRARRAYLKGQFNNYPFLVSSAEFRYARAGASASASLSSISAHDRV